MRPQLVHQYLAPLADHSEHPQERISNEEVPSHIGHARLVQPHDDHIGPKSARQLEKLRAVACLSDNPDVTVGFENGADDVVEYSGKLCRYYANPLQRTTIVERDGNSGAAESEAKWIGRWKSDPAEDSDRIQVKDRIRRAFDAASARVRTPSFSRIWWMWFLTVATSMNSRAPICLLLNP
jgi:hypothetical protein